MSAPPRLLRHRAAQAAALAALAAGLAAPGRAADAPAAPPPSEAEVLLFAKEHLAGMEAPRTLRYRFLREGGGQERLEDDVTMALARGSDGRCCTVHGTYLARAPALALPDVEQARANPVLLYFLEHQVRQLQQRTGGTAGHFRQRIRLALADAATVEATTVRWGGRDVPARSVRIAPYLDDPYRARFEREAATVYRFVLSDAVPGGVWQLSAALPDGSAHQTLTFVEQAERPPDRR